MYEALDGILDPVESRHLIHRDRMASYITDGRDSPIVNVDLNKPRRDLEAMFYLFCARGVGSSSFGAGAETMDFEELRMVLRTLNIVPAYMSSLDAAFYFSRVIEQKQKELAADRKSKKDVLPPLPLPFVPAYAPCGW